MFSVAGGIAFGSNVGALGIDRIYKLFYTEKNTNPKISYESKQIK